MPRFITLSLALLIAIPVFAQDNYLDRSEATLQPLKGRYQIIQSQKARRYTFRLDRYAGHVDQIIAGANGEIGWQRIPNAFLPDVLAPSEDAESEDAPSPTPRFTLFLSGWTAQDMFLMDAVSGLTWILQSVTGHPTLPDGTPMWFPITNDPVIPTSAEDNS